MHFKNFLKNRIFSQVWGQTSRIWVQAENNFFFRNEHKNYKLSSNLPSESSLSPMILFTLTGAASSRDQGP